MAFTHLHVHSHYSLLQALPKVPDLIAAAKKDGMTALALTDNGNLYGAIEFYKECKKAGIKPIIGVDAYVALRGRNEKQAGVDNRRARLVLLAKNLAGYKNLIKLVTLSNLEGFYYKPRIDRELIEKYRDGLIAILPSFSAETSLALKNLDEEKAEEAARWYKTVFGNDCFLELTHHPEISEHEKLMKSVRELSAKSGIPLVAAHDVYYINPEDKKARETLLSVQNGGDTDRAIESDDSDFSFITTKQAEKYFTNDKDALRNSAEIANACNLELQLGKWVFPDYKTESGLSHDEELRQVVCKGLVDKKMAETPEIKSRIEYELKVIKEKGYSPYFLVVSDLLRYAHTAGILTNTRGSAAGSLVSYLASITTVDPIFFKLPFERFLNPERPSAPDIDMDIADNRRDDLIEYAKKKYGTDRVAQVGTFGTMMARGAVRDVSRALGYEYAVGDKIAKLIPMGSQGFPMTLDHAMEITPELKALYKSEADVKTIIDLSKKIEGCARHISVHAAGVVIAPAPLTDFTPLQYDTKGENKIITQYDMYSIDEAGLLKFDFLGIKNLSILADAVERVKKLDGVEIDIENLPLDDKKTFEMLAKGDTIGVFQLNGAGMTRYLKDLQPSNIHDISLMIALYRPGPMENITEYILRKHKQKPASYIHPKMKSFLETTYGVLVYQDDLLMTAIEVAGYSWGEVDKFRKAVGKKIPEEMAKQHEKFVAGCVKHSGMTKEKAESLWKLFEPFQGYGFNKCVTGDTLLSVVSAKEISNLNKNIKSVRIDKVKGGEYVLSFDEITNKLVPAKIKTRVDMGIRPIFKITTLSGKTIRVTGNHPFFAKKPNNLPKKKPRIGLFVDNANLFYGGRLSGWKIDIQKVQRALSSNFDIVFTNYYLAIPNKDDKSYAATIEFIENIKDAVTLKTKPLKYIDSGQIKKGDVDMEIALDVARTIDRLDAVFVLSGDSDYVELRKFVLEKNKKIMFMAYDRSAAWEIRLGKHIIFDRHRNELELSHKKTTPEQELGRLSLALLYDQPPSKSSGLWINAEKLGKRNEIVVIRPTGQTAWDKIVKIERLSPERVYDIEVSGTHTFVGNNFVVHNSHAASYAKVSYQTAYMKANFPAIYMSAVLTADSGDVDKIGETIAECKRMGIPVLPPSVNESYSAFTVVKAEAPNSKSLRMFADPPRDKQVPNNFQTPKEENVQTGDKIRFGLTTIKNFGQGISTAIIQTRKTGGRFKTLGDFLERVRDKNLNKKSLEALIKAGALDEFGERGQMLGNMERLLEYTKEFGKAPANQDSLFGALADSGASNAAIRLDPAPAALPTEKLAWEKELLGLYISGHPLDKYRAVLEKREMNIKKAKEEMKEGMEVVVGGLLEEVKPITTKANDQMAFVRLADFTGSIEVVVFPRVLAEFKNLVVADRCIAIKGRISHRNGEVSLIAEKIKELA